MAYFECIIGGASGDGVALIIECDSSFAGSVITADNGEDSFSDTCPTVAPYTVKFEGIPTGTYTISGVSGGTTITKQFTVVDYVTSLYPTPDGATVTPVNDIQIWLHCADIWDKNYVSLGEVLEDASTLQALIASNNAADYMARSTDFAVSQTLVPTMTSNTTPRGEVIFTNENGNYKGYKAFDNDTSTFWLTTASGSATDFYIGYDFGEPTVVDRFYCEIASAELSYVNSLSYKIQGSNDKQTWQDLSPVYTEKTNMQHNIPNSNSYRYYIVRVTSMTMTTSGASVGGFCKIQFYKLGVTDDENAMTYIGSNDYCADALLADDTWCNAIGNSAYFESVLNVKVPTMTSYTTPSGQVVYLPTTSWTSGREPWRAFANGVAINSATAVVTRVAYGFTQNVRIFKATGQVGPSGAYTYNVTVSLKASNNSDFSNVAFQSDKSVSLTSGSYTQVDFNGVNPNGVSAKYWGYEIPNSYTMSYNTLQFYGRA